jgi:hypothetical protein
MGNELICKENIHLKFFPEPVDIAYDEHRHKQISGSR